MTRRFQYCYVIVLTVVSHWEMSLATHLEWHRAGELGVRKMAKHWLGVPPADQWAEACSWQPDLEVENWRVREKYLEPTLVV